MRLCRKVRLAFHLTRIVRDQAASTPKAMGAGPAGNSWEERRVWCPLCASSKAVRIVHDPPKAGTGLGSNVHGITLSRLCLPAPGRQHKVVIPQPVPAVGGKEVSAPPRDKEELREETSLDGAEGQGRRQTETERRAKREAQGQDQRRGWLAAETRTAVVGGSPAEAARMASSQIGTKVLASRTKSPLGSIPDRPQEDFIKDEAYSPPAPSASPGVKGPERETVIRGKGRLPPVICIRRTNWPAMGGGKMIAWRVGEGALGRPLPPHGAPADIHRRFSAFVL